ncbi:glycoside hydrolase family 61 protein G [Cytidiella melzeri]|nr:glycoside hydrolase family 61 protein G [Cytidiella melzeri]
MKTSFASLLAVVILASSATANTVFSSFKVNGVEQGHGVAVRVPASNAPVTDLTSNSLICNTGFETPVSQTVVTVPAGSQFTAEFHHTSAGYVGPDPSDPLDPTDKGPILAYMAAIPSATQTNVTGLKWFKIWQDGLTASPRQWGSDRLFINQGNATFTIPSCIPAGQYLVRAEAISLINAETYPGAQFFMSCAQIEVTGGGHTQPATVSFPGAYTSSSPGIITDIYSDATYTPPGPAVFTC